jgi:hypothetical protein
LLSRLLRSTLGALSALELRLGYAHHPICYVIGFLLVGVVGLADAKLGLDYARPQQALHALVADGLM